MSKQVTIKTPVKAPPAGGAADAWVARTAPNDRERVTALPVAQAEPMKRFTIDVSEALHRRIKAQCAQRGTKMADVIRDILDREFPAGQGS